MLELLFAKVAEASATALAAVTLGTATAVTAVGVATGGITLPEQAEDRPAAEQTAEKAVELEETAPADEGEDGEDGGEEPGGPAEGTHGQVVTEAVESGLRGTELAEVASDGRAAAGAERAAEASQGRSTAGADDGAAAWQSRPESVPVAPEAEPAEQSGPGRETAANAPLTDAPAGTPGEEPAADAPRGAEDAARR